MTALTSAETSCSGLCLKPRVRNTAGSYQLKHFYHFYRRNCLTDGNVTTIRAQTTDTGTYTYLTIK